MSWLYRESVCFYLFIKAASNPTVKWREGKYRLKWGGLAEEIRETNNSDSKLVQSTSNTSSLSNIEGKSIEKAGSLNNSNSNLLTSDNLNKTNLLATSSVNKSSNNLAQMNNSVNKISNQNHKRTNSFTIMSNNPNNNHNSVPKSNNGKFYELENSYNDPSLFINKNALFLPTNYQQKAINSKGIKSNHQHHHSVSSPLNSLPFQYPLVQLQQQQQSTEKIQSTSTNADLKFSNYRVL